MATKSIRGAKTAKTATTSARKTVRARSTAAATGHYVVRGRVLNPDGSPIAGVSVLVFDVDTGGENLLGRTAAGADGTYEVGYRDAQFRLSNDERRGADVRVNVYDKAGRPLGQSKTVRNAAVELNVDVTLPLPGFSVSGTVRDSEGRALVGVRVVAYDKDLRTEERVAATLAGEGGRYALEYSAASFRRAERANAELVVRAFAAEVADDATPLAESSVRMNAETVAVVDLVADLPARSEWEQITAGVVPLLEGQGPGGEWLPPWDLTGEDIGFVADETGLNREHLSSWVLAARLARDHALLGDVVPVEGGLRSWLGPSAGGYGGDLLELIVLYGWQRDGQPRVFSLLIDLPAQDLMASLQRAVEARFIPALDAASLKRVEEALGTARLQAVLRPAEEGQPATLGDALRLADPAGRLALDKIGGPGQTIAAMLQVPAGTVPPWKKIGELAGDDKLLASIQRTVGLQRLTRGHAPLMQALLPRREDPSPSLADLAAYTAEHWIGLAKKHGVPGSIEAATEDERIALYGRQLARDIEGLHPAAFIRHRIGNGQIGLAKELREPIDAFLNANPQWRLGEKSVLLMQAAGEINDAGLDAKTLEAITPELVKIERIGRLTPTLELVGPLLASGYESARDIVRRHSREGFLEAIRLEIGNEVDAARIYDAATGAVATAEALVLAHSPRFAGPDLPVFPQAPQASQQVSSAGYTALMAVNAPGVIQAPNLQQLFGNQDYCECGHGASLYGPAAYLADLLQMLDRGPRFDGRSALQVLLMRRPDLAELDLSGDNTDTTLPYIDLVLETLEAPDWEGGIGYRVIRGGTRQNPTNAFDAALDRGELPAALVEDIATYGLVLSDSCTVARGAAVANSGGASFASWLIRDLRTGLKIRLIGVVEGVYRLRVTPQCVAGMAKGYRPWPRRLSRVIDAVGKARFPWKLPFDVARDEANAWLDHLGPSRRDVLAAFLGSARWTDVDMACEGLGLERAERDICIRAPDASSPAHRDWGFSNPALGPGDSIFDPIAGATGTFDTASSRIHWRGGEADRWDPPQWQALLKNVSLLRARARLTHRELLGVLETRFVRGSGARLPITGAECNSGFMRLEAMDEALARRVHLFVRLWRRLGWTTVDTDRAILARADNISGAGANVAFTDSLLLFAGNVQRLHQLTAVPVALLLDLHATGALDTARHWDHSGAQPMLALSRYEAWFDNPALGRPRVPELRLDAAGTALEPALRPEAGVARPRISDHATYVAAVLALPEPELASLLPSAAVSIPPVEVSGGARVGDGVELDAADLKEVECVLGTLSGASAFALLIEESDDGRAFAAVPPAQIGGANPVTLDAGSALLRRFGYTGARKFLRATVTPIAGVNASLWITVRVLKAAGVVADELSLANLARLCRHAVLRRVARQPIDRLRTLVALSAIDPLAAPAGPQTTLAFLDTLDLLARASLSIAQADEWLRGPQGATAQRLEHRAEQVLAAARAGSRAARDESTVTGDQRSVLLNKVLTGIGWDVRLIADVLGPEVLGIGWDDYEIPLDMTAADFAAAALPAIFRHDADRKHLTVARDVRPAALRAALAALLPAAAGALRIALQALDALALRREAVLQSAQGLLRARLLPTFRAALGAVPNLAFEVPESWRGRFFHDHERSQLCFVGWMRPDEVPVLKQLGAGLPAGAGFGSAVDALYASSANHVPDAGNVLVAARGAASGLSIERLLLETIGLQERCGLILELLLPAWRRQRLRSRLAGSLTEDLGCSPEVAAVLLDLPGGPAGGNPGAPSFEALLSDAQLLASDPATRASRAAFPQAFDAAARVLVLGDLADALRLDAEQVTWLQGTWTGLALTELPTVRRTAVPAGGWPALVALAHVVALRGDPLVGPRMLGLVLAASAAPGVELARLASALECTETTLRTLMAADALDIGTVALRNPARLRDLLTCLDLVRTSGISAALLVGLRRVQHPARPPAEAEAEARMLRQAALGSAAGEGSDAERKVLDRIRERRRDAAVDHLVHARNVRDANDLYGLYLIDPQMGPCMPTSRIVQAIGTVQLFIQRCLMQLEPAAPPHVIDKTHWTWMRNYRVWEANRKVLLYPENWIEPELRDDKTPFFEDLVSSLQQADASGDKAQEAVQAFLEKLTDLSKVEVAGTCSSYDDAGHLLVTHVFARSLSEPRTYWYRQFRKLEPQRGDSSMGHWTAWQALSLDIEGDHLFPFVWQGRLFLFWAVFSEEAETPSDLQAAQGRPPVKLWRLKIAWSEFKSGAWSKRRMLQERVLYLKFNVQAISPASFYFLVSGLGSATGVTISVYWGRGPEWDPPAAPLDQVKPLQDPVAWLYFDGHQLRLAAALLAYQSLTGGGPGGSVGTVRWSVSTIGLDLAETPIDTAPSPVIAAHWNMQVRQSWKGPPVRLVEGQNWPVEVLARTPRAVRLLHSPDHPKPAFAAPSQWLAGLQKAAPFVLSDSLHQFFVYPTRKWTWTVTVGVGGTLMMTTWEQPKLHFQALDWPPATRLRRTLSTAGIDALYSFDTQDRAAHPPSRYFNEYAPVPDIVEAAPDGDLEYSMHSASATYNFELFFHAPLAIACALSKNQRFDEARRWFHYIFDPTDASSGTSAARYWRFRPFRESAGLRIDDLVRRLADPRDQSLEKLEFQGVIAQWKDQPFKPHLVARMRLRSYMYTVVMKYLDNLIAWGDQLFRRDTRESLNEATQLYILAAQILGRRPEGIPRRTRPVLRCWHELAASAPDDLGNALVDAENLIPATAAGTGSTGAPNLPNLTSLYFCVPGNPRLGEYHDKVEDRLFKLRNCMNIDGVKRELALFAPPIDPGLLVKAAAAGLDLAAVLADSQSPLPLYRFNVMVQKANELCGEVKALGGALLSAIEKGDAEALALLRSSHELQLLKGVRLVKEAQVQEARANIDALGISLQAAQTRFTHYAGLVSQLEPMSIPTGPVVEPTLERLGAAALESLSSATSFAQSLTGMVDPIGAASMGVIKQMLARASEALAASLPAEGMDTAQVPMNAAEKRQLTELKSAHDLQQKAADQRMVAQMLAMIPDFTLGAQGFASSPVVQFQLGGTLLSKVANFAASATDSKASEHTYRATLHSMLAGYQRRASDWLLQAQSASWDIAQIGTQLKAATLRLAVTVQELNNHDQQAAHARQTEEFMRSKFSNQELYAWMSGQLSSLYFDTYKLAYDTAKRAERCFAHELGVEAAFLKFGYWDGLRKGLLAGEMLSSDIKRMEVAYLNQNARELEITRHVSLRELDPLAIVQLQQTGECEFRLPEALFDIDYPGHYFRRIKSVSVSVPCVVGPYTGLSATLTLLGSTVRVRSVAAQGSYSHEDNFHASFLPTQAIAASTGQNDAGMFEFSFRDERYLPFEGAGAISRWRLELPGTFRRFDYATITDVVMHVRYTARDAGGSLRQLAEASLAQAMNAVLGNSSIPGFARLLSLRDEYPEEWGRLRNSVDASGSATERFALTRQRFPFHLGRRAITISKVDLYPVPKPRLRTTGFHGLAIRVPGAAQDATTERVAEVAGLAGRRLSADWSLPPAGAAGDEVDWVCTVPAASIASFRAEVEDILVLCHYTVGAETA